MSEGSTYERHHLGCPRGAQPNTSTVRSSDLTRQPLYSKIQSRSFLKGGFVYPRRFNAGSKETQRVHSIVEGDLFILVVTTWVQTKVTQRDPHQTAPGGICLYSSLQRGCEASAKSVTLKEFGETREACKRVHQLQERSFWVKTRKRKNRRIQKEHVQTTQDTIKLK